MIKASTRTELLESAYKLMLSKGYPATSVDEICDGAGVSTAVTGVALRFRSHAQVQTLDAEHQRLVRLTGDLEIVD